MTITLLFSKENYMRLPQLKPLNISHNNSGENLNADLAIIVIDEMDVEKRNIKSIELKKLDSEFGGTISNLVSFGDFEGKWLQTTSSIASIQKVAKRILLIGSGKK